MALTCAQIINLACSIAKTPGMTAQAGQILNAVLAELAQNFDLDINRGTYVFNFNPSLITDEDTYPNIQPGGGPYELPEDYLRMYGQQWFLLGVPYPMIPCDLSEYDNLVQQAGLQSYPYIFATDMSQTPPTLVVWPPASGAYQCQIRYYKQPTDITTPQSSSTVPWFSQSTYLYTRVAGELMKIAGDMRWQSFLSDEEGSGGAGEMLRKYLKQVNDKRDRSQRVTLDRRRFQPKFSLLRNTKRVGW